MKNKKTALNLLYITLYLMIAAVGLNNSLGITRGEFEPPIFYTSLSGLICFIYFSLALVKAIVLRFQGKEVTNFFVFPRLKGAITICITVTLLVYHFVVYEGSILSIDTDIYNLITHYIVPVLVIGHYFIFDEKGIYKKMDPLVWLVIPLSYFSWANVVALISPVPYWDGKSYPYGFIDLTLHSVSKVAITFVVLLAFFILLGYGLYACDQAFAKKNTQSA